MLRLDLPVDPSLTTTPFLRMGKLGQRDEAAAGRQHVKSRMEPKQLGDEAKLPTTTHCRLHAASAAETKKLGTKARAQEVWIFGGWEKRVKTWVGRKTWAKCTLLEAKAGGVHRAVAAVRCRSKRLGTGLQQAGEGREQRV